MSAVTELRLSPGDVLYNEGDPNDHAFLIADGEVILYYMQGDRRVDCERRTNGHMVGEVSILTGKERTVTVEALSDCLIYQVSADHILNMFARLDPMLRAFVETSIDFVARFNSEAAAPGAQVPMAPITLHHAESLISEYQMQLDIERGLAAGEFQPVFQPIVSLDDHSIVGFEALMRWSHFKLGNVPPDRFISVAERTGAIGAITDVALTKSADVLAKIRAETGRDVFASVNISGQDIGRDGFADFVQHVFDRSDLPADALRLELTETDLLPNSEVAERNLDRLKEFGYGISVDDFGTGYSNLAYLKTLPLTTLKIDRAFVDDLCSNPVSHGIVRMLIGLGRDLDVAVVAEGIENTETAQKLRDLGCGFAQGYYFSKPVGEDQLRDLIEGARGAQGGGLGRRAVSG